MKRRDYLPPTVLDSVDDDVLARGRAVAAAELAVSMGRKSPCLRGVRGDLRGFCLEQFEALKGAQ